MASSRNRGRRASRRSRAYDIAASASYRQLPSDPVTGVLYNKLGLSTAAGLEAAEREIAHATAGLSASSHHWRKLVGVEFCGVRWTPLSRPWFFAQAMSVYP
jgi:hypothetical protein